MMQLLTSVEKFIDNYQLLKPQQSIVVGLSGGPDSVFLLHVLLHIRQRMSLTIIAAHLDHEWRESSKNDAQFCAQLCARLAVPLVSPRASELGITIKQTGSQEDVGRQLRRALFAQVQQDYGAHAIALAHHADDQLETFFIRLIRGATVSGFACMRPKDGVYIRPLLGVHKSVILAYLHEHHLSYVVDPTNESTDYLRNRIRKQLVPTLVEIDERSQTNIQKAIVDMQDTDAFLDHCVRQAYAHICPVELGVVSLEQFFKIDLFLQKRVLVYWLYQQQVKYTLSASFIDEILRFLRNTKSKRHVIDRCIINKIKGCAIITARNDVAPQ